MNREFMDTIFPGSTAVAYFLPVTGENGEPLMRIVHSSEDFTRFWTGFHQMGPEPWFHQLQEAPQYPGLRNELQRLLSREKQSGKESRQKKTVCLQNGDVQLTLFPGPGELLGVFIESAAGSEPDALRETGDLNRFFDLSPDLLCVVDREGTFLSINRAWEELLGYPAQEILQAGVLNMVHPEDVAPTREALETLGAQNPVSRFINRYSTSDGTWRSISWLARPFGDRFYASGRDVTETLKIRSQLEESELRFRGLVSSLDDVIFTLDTQGRHTGVYGRWLEKAGLTEQDFLGKSATEIYGQEAGRIHEGPNRRALQGETVVYQWSLRDPQGELRYFQTSLSPLVSSGGTITGLAGVGRDVTLLVQAGQQVRAAEEEKTRILDALPDRITYLSPDYRVLWANRTALRYGGLTREQMAGRRCFEVYRGPGPGELCPVRHFLETGEMIRSELPLEDGSLWKVSCVPLFDDAGQLTAVVETATDVTETRALENRVFEEKETLRTTLMSIGDGVIAVDRKGLVTQLNQAAQEMTGWSLEEATGQPVEEVFRIEEAGTGRLRENPVQKVLESAMVLGLENNTLLVSRQGRRIHIADSAAPIRNVRQEITGVVLVFRDVSAEVARREEILRLSYFDALTGLYNRRYFEEKLTELEEKKALPVAIILGDLNGLKLINDVFGHLEGDRALIKAGEIFRQVCSGQDVAARWGGDEFVLCLPDTEETRAEEICREILEACHREADGEIRLSVSVGFSVRTSTGKSLRDVLKEAEDRMYRQKLLESKSLRSSVIQSMKRTLFEKSNETEEHGERLKIWCRAVGQQLALPDMEIYELELLALLHDIGKVAIADRILKKPGALDVREWEEMRRHPEIGYRIAQSAPELALIAELILSHHERYDGTGYPRGIAGEEIPLLSRILAVIDAYDAMTSNRPYREAMEPEEAARELSRHAGTQFDPGIVRVFLEKVLQFPADSRSSP